jgi:phage recombination protein Bet
MTADRKEQDVRNELTTQQGGAHALPEDETIRVLRSSLYPGAAPESIKLVLGYCRAAGLDPMQKPVHIVPMWDSKASAMRDVVMPGIGLYRTQASRTGQYVGKSEPEYGPMITEVIGGAKITFPEWAKVTVRRIVGGIVAEFTATEYWMENYAVKGGKERSVAPNAMWTKRPRGQIAKCATAQALREAFPELGSQATAEEMEGRAIQPADDEQSGIQAREELYAWIVAAQATTTDADAAKVWQAGGKALSDAKDRAGYAAFKDAVIAHRTALKQSLDARTVDAEATPVDDEFVQAMDAAEGKTDE